MLEIFEKILKNSIKTNIANTLEIFRKALINISRIIEKKLDNSTRKMSRNVENYFVKFQEILREL